MRLLLPTNLPLVEESFLSSPFSRLLPELQLSSFQQSEQEGKSEGLQIISISLAPLFSLLLSSLPDFSTGSGGKQEHQWYTAARSAAGGWTSITRVTQGTAEPAPWPTLIGRQSENQKSQVLLADLQMGAESCGGIMYTAKENSSGLQYLWTLFLSYLSVSLSLSLSMTSELTALFYSCLATHWHAWVCGAEQEERCGREKRSSSPQPSLSLSEVWMGVEYFSFQQPQHPFFVLWRLLLLL